MLDKIPVVDYGDAAGVTDITQRMPNVYIPVATTSNDQPTRADIIASTTYNDSTLDWLVYIANAITDPLDISVVSDTEFDQLITEKYGSIQVAMQKYVWWENNWRAHAEQTITPASYNSLVPTVRQLFDVVRDAYGAPVEYTRKRIDLRKSTSMIVTYVVADCPYPTDTRVLIKQGSTVVGNGRIGYIDEAKIIVDNIVGNHVGTGISDGTTTFAITEVTSVTKVVTDDEAAYYSPVSVYEAAHRQLSDNRRTIGIVPKNQARSVASEITQQF